MMGFQAKFNNIVRNYRDATFGEQWFGGTLLCTSRKIASLEYPFLLHVRVKYMAYFNLSANCSTEADWYVILLVDAIFEHLL